ncbi:hypothetical protein ACFL3T_03170 [Patescibacteria group bacterium]
MKSSTKQRNGFISLAVIALVILVGGWFYMNAQPSTVEVVSESDFYFEKDNPEVQINLLNPKEAKSGKIKVTFDNESLKILKNETADGVSVATIGDTISYDLSKEYFDSKTTTLATLKFDVVKQSIVNFEVDESSYLNIGGEDVSLEKTKDLELTLGIIPAREENKGNEKTEGLGNL